MRLFHGRHIRKDNPLRRRPVLKLKIFNIFNIKQLYFPKHTSYFPTESVFFNTHYHGYSSCILCIVFRSFVHIFRMKLYKYINFIFIIKNAAPFVWSYSRYTRALAEHTIYNLLKLRTSYRLFTKVKSNKVMVSSRYKLELIIHYVVRSGQSSIMLSSCPLPTICY